MAKVAQLVRVSVCGTECREFESHLSPQLKNPLIKADFFYAILLCLRIFY